MTLAEAGLFAGAASHFAPSVFSYNRQGYLFDKGQQVTRNFQALSYKVQKINLHRQDARDIAELTLSRTSQYHFVTALELGICATMMGPGKIVHGVAPEWVLWHQRVALVTAFAFLLASMWLSMRASLIAASHNARLQLRFLRPPLPGYDRLGEMIASSDAFEREEVGKVVFRLPFLSDAVTSTASHHQNFSDVRSCKSGERTTRSRFSSGMETTGLDENSANSEALQEDPTEDFEGTIDPRHVANCRSLQAKWSSCDAYSQLCMSVGTYSLLMSFVYYLVAYDFYNHRSLGSSIGAAAVLITVLFALLQMDHIASCGELLLVSALMSGGPVLLICRVLVDGCDRMFQWSGDTMHILFTLWLLRQGAMSPAKGLPKRFRPAAFLNVLGPVTDEERVQSKGSRGFDSVPEESGEDGDAEQGTEGSTTTSRGSASGADDAKTEVAMSRSSTFEEREEKSSISMPAKVYQLLCTVCIIERVLNMAMPLQDNYVSFWHGLGHNYAHNLGLTGLDTSETNVTAYGATITWALPKGKAFFRPDNIACWGQAGESDPEVVIASNSFLLYQLSKGSATLLKCPVARHDDVVVSRCGAAESCFAIVASSGKLWRCQASAEDPAAIVQNDTGSLAPAEPSEEVASPIAVLPSTAGAPAFGPFQFWAATDVHANRVFAAPARGPIMEFALDQTWSQANMLIPVADLPLPKGLQAEDILWQQLQVVNGTVLLAIAEHESEQAVLTWSVEAGRFLGSWPLPASSAASRAPPLCAVGTQLFGDLAPALSGHSLVLRRWRLPAAPAT